MSAELSRADPPCAAAGGRLIYEHLCLREQRDKTLPRFDMIHRKTSRQVKYLQNACNKISAFYHHCRHQISYLILASKTVLKRNRQQLSLVPGALSRSQAHTGLHLQGGIFKVTTLAPM